MARKAAKRTSAKGSKAKSTASSRRRGGARSKAPRDPRARVLKAALDLAATDGWGSVDMADIAAAAGMAPDDVQAVFASKAAIVAGFFGDVDDAILAGGEPDAGDTARDRLFDVLMRSFDALQPHKSAVASILGHLACRPVAAISASPRFICSMAGMVEAAGLSARGPCGALRTKGLALIYANALRAWLRDNSADMAATMAALDKGLRQAERAASLCQRLGPASVAA